MKVDEIRELPTEEIVRQIRETERELFNLRFQRETERLEKPAELRKAKKLIARFKTVLKERELQAAAEEKVTP